MAKEEIPASNSASGSGEYGQGEPKHTPFVDYSERSHLDVEVPTVSYDGDPVVSQPTPEIPSQDAITLPFQPRVYKEGNYWFFEFTSAGVIFLPVGKVSGDNSGNDWHIPWNDAWPFRPKLRDHPSTSPTTPSGTPTAINDVHAYDGSSNPTRRPRLLLSTGNQNIIYVEITFVQNENSIADHKDGTQAYSGVKTLLPNYKIVGDTDSVTGSDFSDHAHPVDLETTSMKDNVGAPFGTSPNGNLTPHAYVPIAERNYSVQVDPEVKVLSALDGDSDGVFSVKNDSWRNLELTKKFVWGSVTFNDSTDPETPLLEWWRFDCPTYIINNHTVDDTSDGTRDVPLPHEDDDDTAHLIAPDAPNTGLSGTI